MKVLIFSLLVAFMSSPCFADDAQPQLNYFVAGLIGNASMNSGGGNHLVYGAELGDGIYRTDSGTLAIGFYLGRAGVSLSGSGFTTSSNYVATLPELLWRNAFGTGLYWGGRAGWVILNSSISTPTVSSTANTAAFAWGPALGYDLQIPGSSLGLTLDASYLNISGGSMTFPNVATVDFGARGAFVLQSALKFSW